MATEAVQSRRAGFAAQATVRLHKFYLLLSQHKDAFVVPTLDIDLAWHTHQLHPTRYCAYTTKILGGVLNHDDTIAKPKLGNGFEKTALMWAKQFGGTCSFSFFRCAFHSLFKII
ncbi:hypothetical protein BC828DRAFT_349637 [Blastocladiella britannica]|nr:hypothetical protein BC828DRAFT_349637 [Blastocladiella britannica]